MSELDRSLRPAAGQPASEPRPAAGAPRAASPARPVRQREAALDAEREIGFAELATWVARRGVTPIAIAVIVAQLVWKASFLSRFYFRQGDIQLTELALHSRLGWTYLSYAGSGHLHPGVMLGIWILARVALYNWAAACAVLLALGALASVALWWLLRLLTRNRPAMLIPLVLYLLTPVAFPADSWLQSGLETLPLQAVIFLSLIAHIKYLRTGRTRYLVTAAILIAVGVVFAAKAALLPLLLFGVTAGFLVSGPMAVTWRRSLRRYWRAWLTYGGIGVAYLTILVVVLLRQSPVRPPSSPLPGALSFAADLVRENLLPGLLGGPWSWSFGPNDVVACSAAPALLGWLSLLIVIGIVVASGFQRARAWRAWAILAGWIVLADLVPILIGRLTSLGAFSAPFELDTRYVADAAPVAAVCVALAFWPVVRAPEVDPQERRTGDFFTGERWRLAGLVLTGVLVIGSVVSVSRYEVTTRAANAAGAAYVDSVRAALARDLPRGTVIVDGYLPPGLMLGAQYGRAALESEALGPLVRNAGSLDVRWVTRPSGNIDTLAMFGASGVLYRAAIQGTTSQPLPAGRACWPVSNGTVVIPFNQPAASGTELVRVGYLASAGQVGEDVTVGYGRSVGHFAVAAGLNAAYLPVAGSADSVTIHITVPGGLCVGDIEAGNLQPGYPLASSPAQK